MHIQVTDVLFDDDANLMMVEFLTPFGSGVGEWRGAAPERYSHHEVEVEVEGRLAWGKELVASGADSFLLAYDVDHLVTLQGKLEAIEADGLAYLRLGSGLIVLETEGDGRPPLDSFIRAQVSKLVLFPYEL